MDRTSDLSAIFGALADQTRFAIVERLLAEGERPVGELAKTLPVTAPAVTHHIRVLEKAGVVERRAHRQQRLIRLRPGAFENIDDWLSRHRAFWSQSLDRLEEQMKKQRETKES